MDMVKQPKLVIDGREFLFTELSDEARSYVNNWRLAEREVARLRARIFLAETAKASFEARLRVLVQTSSETTTVVS